MYYLMLFRGQIKLIVVIIVDREVNRLVGGLSHVKILGTTNRML